ncbi:hypothetical protein SAMN02745163_03946 [Clostridium cavendishii DSM 21758]|uniref:Copper amine oxidase N-terminal domain-containing protein n=1 Tax=Clostridium cavendishii DSM 21758 TaxID=1121302 RepID=A0A1M6T4P2_9CLOT|nr:hypothetical protein [Clostridium cavendishii]SHK51866.1 hypothetical protein SAMN02745163_03946 [Clostridium cavendishii DSM 21758]
MKKHIIAFLSIIVLIINISFSASATTVSKGSSDIDNLSIKSTDSCFNLILEQNSSYEITNTSKDSMNINITSITKNYNIIIYDNSGKIIDSKYSTTDAIIINSGQKVRVSSTGTNVTIAVPNQLKASVKTIKAPVFYTLAVRDNEYYVLDNTTGMHLKFPTNTTYESTVKYDKVSYDESGVLREAIKNSFCDVFVGNKTKIRIGKSGIGDLNVYLPYEYSDICTKVNIPVFDTLIVKQGEYYEFNNTTSNILPIFNEGSFANGKSYDKIVYDPVGNMFETYKDYLGTERLQVGYKMRIGVNTPDTEEFYIPYEYKNLYKKLSEPIFKEKILKKGEAFQIKNTTDYVVSITNSLQFSNGYYTSIVYDKAGNKISEIKNDYGTLKLNPGEWVNITLSEGEKLAFYIPSEIHIIEI